MARGGEFQGGGCPYPPPVACPGESTVRVRLRQVPLQHLRLSPLGERLVRVLPHLEHEPMLGRGEIGVLSGLGYQGVGLLGGEELTPLCPSEQVEVRRQSFVEAIRVEPPV